MSHGHTLSSTSAESEFFCAVILKFQPQSQSPWQHRSLTAIGQKKASTESLVFTGDTRNKDREKSSGQTYCSIFEQ
jgi:hypothetical protein